MHKFDKGCGFAIVTNDTFKVKIEKQLGKAEKTKINPKKQTHEQDSKKPLQTQERKKIYKQDLF